MDEQRVHPHNIEAEQGVLGAMLLGDTRAIDEAVTMLVPEDFYRQSHREIYSRMLELQNSGQAIDTITLVNALRTAGKLDDVGGEVLRHLDRLREGQGRRAGEGRDASDQGRRRGVREAVCRGREEA